MPQLDSETSRWFTKEVQPHEGVLRAYLRGAFPTVRDVDDVVQESYLRVWKTLAAQPILSVKSFLFQVARRLAIDAVRHDRASPIDAGRELAALNVALDEPDAAATLTHAELKAHLVTAIANLPDRYREIVIMRRLDELPQKVVADRLGLAERTVETLLARGIKKVAKSLRQQGLLERYRR